MTTQIIWFWEFAWIIQTSTSPLPILSLPPTPSLDFPQHIFISTMSLSNYISFHLTLCRHRPWLHICIQNTTDVPRNWMGEVYWSEVCFPARGKVKCVFIVIKWINLDTFNLKSWSFFLGSELFGWLLRPDYGYIQVHRHISVYV